VDERHSYQAKISKLNNQVTLLNFQFSNVMKQVKLMSIGTDSQILSELMLSHPERGDVPIRNVNTMENCFSWTSQQNSQNANPTGMLSTMLKRLVTSKEPDILHLDSINNKRGDVLVKGVRTINECFKGNSRQKEQSEKQLGMLHTMWKHQYIPNLIEPSHYSSKRNISGKCSSLETNKTNFQSFPMKDCVKEKIVFVKDLVSNKNTKQLKKLKGKLVISQNKELQTIYGRCTSNLLSIVHLKS
jgi:hypothetical protein